MRKIVFDIETGPLPNSELEQLIEPFDPAAVKVGNIKDPAKIEAKIEECRANHWTDFVDGAALSAVTGRVLAIGIQDSDGFKILGDNLSSEAEIIHDFWHLCQFEMGRLNTMIGFNTHLFDLPFLVRRSWKLGVKVPPFIRRGRYWADEMIDLRNDWQLGDRPAEGSLNAICKHLGLGQKTGNGKDFAGLWILDRKKAIEYLRQDLALTSKVATIFGH